MSLSQEIETQAIRKIAIAMVIAAGITRKAAEEINSLASSSLDVSEKAGEMLKTLVPSIRNTTELVQEISSASNEQNIGASQINQAIQQFDQITQQNSAISQEIAMTAEELATQSQHLQHLVHLFVNSSPPLKLIPPAPFS
ncbi:MAG: hypothetical protein GY801_30935 [bacterium]|nr:hypothetical protein [bacterium]